MENNNSQLSVIIILTIITCITLGILVFDRKPKDTIIEHKNDSIKIYQNKIDSAYNIINKQSIKIDSLYTAKQNVKLKYKMLYEDFYNINIVDDDSIASYISSQLYIE